MASRPSKTCGSKNNMSVHCPYSDSTPRVQSANPVSLTPSAMNGIETYPQELELQDSRLSSSYDVSDGGLIVPFLGQRHPQLGSTSAPCRQGLGESSRRPGTFSSLLARTLRLSCCRIDCEAVLDSVQECIAQTTMSAVEW